MRKINSFVQAALVSSALFSAYLYAAPENPTPITVDNDGDTIVIRKMGDEHYRFTQTPDGYMVVRDAKGVYYYADEQGEISSVKVRDSSRRSVEEKAFLKSLNKKKVMRAHQKKNPDRHPRLSQSAKRPAWVPTVDTDKPPVLPMPQASVHVKGTNKFPVIMISASGSKNRTDSTSMFKILNQENYSEGGYTGSVHDYFVDQSFGIFNPTFDLFYVTVDKSLNSYEKQEATLIKEAISKLSSKYPNFDGSRYDSDGDGVIDATGFLFAGANENLGGFQYELDWNGVSASAGGRRFNSYFIISDEDAFSVFVHEFSHTMGLRDHYCVFSDDCYADFSNSSSPAPGTHFWDVMATGMYANNGLTPPGYSGFERNFMGWMDYKNLSSSSEITTITPLNTTNVAYKVSVRGDNDEWWVLENRQKTKWDAHLPNSGMLIWHIDYDSKAWDDDAVNDTPDHQGVDVVEAGNVKVNSYQSGFEARYFMDDPFPGSQNVTSFGPFTSWAGVSQGIQLYSITEKNGNVCFATQSGVSVNDCSAAVASSSSEKLSSSSSQVESSSSSYQETSSSSMVMDNIYTVSIQVELPISDNYEPTKVDLSDVFEKLGISGDALELYSSNKLIYNAVMPSNSIDNTPSTANAPGHWFNENGEASAYDDGYVYSELDFATKSANVGHYPNKVSVGDTYEIGQALTYNGNTVIFKLLVNLTDSGTTGLVKSPMAGNVRVAVAGNMIQVYSSDKNLKKATIFDLQGNVVSNKLFRNRVDFDLTENHKGVFIIRVMDGRRVVVSRQLKI